MLTFLAETPREVLVAMHQQIQFIEAMQHRIYDDGFDREALAKLREDFTKRKEALKKGFSWTKFEHCTSKILRILISLRRTRRYVRGSFRVRDACSVLASCSLGDFDDTL